MIADKISHISETSITWPRLAEVEYFRFEEDFMEDNVRCIPMIVRFKLDAAGIKLKLQEWCRFSLEERTELALRKCASPEERHEYRNYLKQLVWKYMTYEATEMTFDLDPCWADNSAIPEALQARLLQESAHMKVDHWRGLRNLQRFALLKLCSPGHESKNFLKALEEFGIRPGSDNNTQKQ